MAIDLVREKIMSFAYPTSCQLNKWKIEHQCKRNRLLGLRNLKCLNISICPLCIIWNYSNYGDDDIVTDKCNYNRRRDFYVIKNRFSKHFVKILEKYPQECYNTHMFNMYR